MANRTPSDSIWAQKNEATRPGRYADEYRGLSNQGATCYLNSLLQALYMTPEFRHGIFKWTYDQDKDGPKEECIPYQLQNLFGRMQVCKKGSLKTEALTNSFGWGNAEAFQQQDVQELCRVLFDCLEETFKGTDNESLVNDLYQGKMVDYLKTIGYEYESTKETEFLDISLQVKTFGSDVAMNSVTESLESYLKPERLEGDNQYFCEEADKKLDAIKGFRLDRIPYVLTLQLKRFDLDYTTFQRIKLNDQVRFPLVLNMNPYVGSGAGGKGDGEDSQDENGETRRRNSFDARQEMEQHRLEGKLTASETEKLREQAEAEAALKQEEEGLPLPDLVDANGDKSPDQLREEEVRYMEDEPVDVEALLKEGPWVYELYAVLIHSGSALGGHYYAYIKNLEDGRWYNFNDSVVTEIEVRTVRASWGGTPKAVFGSSMSAGSGSSTTGMGAYMLMYRQIDPSRNVKAPSVSDVPEDVMKAVQAEQEAEAKRREEEERKANQLSLRVVFGTQERTVSISKHSTLSALKIQAAKDFGLALPPSLMGESKTQGESEPATSSTPSSAAVESVAVETVATATATATASVVNGGGSTTETSISATDSTAENWVRPGDLRLREYSNQYRMMLKPYEASSELSTLASLKFYDYKTTALELRAPGADWEVFDDCAMVIKVVMYNETTNAFHDPVAVHVARDGTVGALRDVVAKRIPPDVAGCLPDPPTPGSDLTSPRRLQLLKLVVDCNIARANVYTDDSKRLSRDLYVYEGQIIYAEWLPRDVSAALDEKDRQAAELAAQTAADAHEANGSTPVTLTTGTSLPGSLDAEELLELGHPSRALDVYEASMNQMKIKFSSIGGSTCDFNIFADRRWTVDRLRSEICKTLGLEGEKEKLSFRMRKQMLQGSEIKQSERRTLREEALFNDCRIYLIPGQPPMYGECYWTFFLYTTCADTPEEHMVPGLRDVAPEGTISREPVSAGDDTDKPKRQRRRARPGREQGTSREEDPNGETGETDSTDVDTESDSDVDPAAGVEAVPRPMQDDANSEAGTSSQPHMTDSDVGKKLEEPDAGAGSEMNTKGDDAVVPGGTESPSPTDKGEDAPKEEGIKAGAEGSQESRDFGTLPVAKQPSADDFGGTFQLIVREDLTVTELRQMVLDVIVKAHGPDVLDKGGVGGGDAYVKAFRAAMAQTVSKEEAGVDSLDALVKGDEGSTVSATAPRLNDKASLDVNRVRLREKLSNRCTRILRNGTTLKAAMQTIYEREVAVQILPAPEDLSVSHPEKGFVVVMRIWHKFRWSLGTKFEVYMAQDESLATVNTRISAMIGIHPEHLRFMKMPVFANLKLHQLNAQQWHAFYNDSRAVGKASLHLMEGDVLVVCDNSEPLKELTKAEKQSIEDAKYKPTQRTNYASSSYTSSFTYPPGGMATSSSASTTTTKATPKKEKGIKIKTRHDRELEQEQRRKDEAAAAAAAAASTADTEPGIDGEDWGDAEPLSIGTGSAQSTTSPDETVRDLFAADIDLD